MKTYKEFISELDGMGVGHQEGGLQGKGPGDFNRGQRVTKRKRLEESFRGTPFKPYHVISVLRTPTLGDVYHVRSSHWSENEANEAKKFHDKKNPHRIHMVLSTSEVNAYRKGLGINGYGITTLNEISQAAKVGIGVGLAGAAGTAYAGPHVAMGVGTALGVGAYLTHKKNMEDTDSKMDRYWEGQTLEHKPTGDHYHVDHVDEKNQKIHMYGTHGNHGRRIVHINNMSDYKDIG